MCLGGLVAGATLPKHLLPVSSAELQRVRSPPEVPVSSKVPGPFQKETPLFCSPG